MHLFYLCNKQRCGHTSDVEFALDPKQKFTKMEIQEDNNGRENN